jgi:hypothetical protein
VYSDATAIIRPSAPHAYSGQFDAAISLRPGQLERKRPAMIRSQLLLKRTESIVAILLSALTIFLLAVRATHAGALWRDECAVVQLAEAPAASDIFRNFPHEAFPPLFPLIVRVYTAVFGPTDAALRIFGFLVGCSVVGAFWISSRLLRGDVPLVALALMSLNTTFFVWGTTIRGYGLGSALIVLIFGWIGSLLLDANRQRIIAAALISLFAVQILLYNSVLLLAIVGAAVLILVFQLRFKLALPVVVICGIALLFLFPCVPAYLRARDWNILVRGWPTSYSLWKHFEVALGHPGYSIPALWYCIGLGSIGVLIFRLYRNRNIQLDQHQQLIWFAILASILSLVGCYAFLCVLSYTTSNWYYLAFTCVVAAALDLVARVLCTNDWLRFGRLGVAIAALIVAPFADWTALTERQTNVDLAAISVTERAAANDLVVVVPWQFGISFQRYFHGPAPWMTIPNIADHRFHRYDLIKEKMLSAHPIDDLETAIRSTLSMSGRLWLVGGLNLPRPEEGPLVLPTAPGSRFKWDNRAYTASWWQQLSVLCVLHADKIDSVPLPLPASVQIDELEQTSLTVVEGWH